MRYIPYEKYLLRKPLLSKKSLFEEGRTKELDDVVESFLSDGYFISSLYWSSPDLYKTIRNYQKGLLKEDKRERLYNTLKKYCIRASTRCTPYGTLAGVVLKDINESQNTNTESIRKANIDMGLLDQLKNHIENNEQIKYHLRYKINNTISQIPDQFRFQEPVNQFGLEKFQLSSLEKNEYLEKLASINTFTEYHSLYNIFSTDFEEKEIIDFLDELIDMKFLVSELQIKLTDDNLENYKKVTNRLLTLNIIEAKKYQEIFLKIDHCINLIETSSVDFIPLPEISEINYLLADLQIKTKHLFHVDLIQSSNGNFKLDNKTVRNLNNIFIILNNLKISSPIQSDLNTFKKIFNNRYESRQVSLTEVLDTEFGIGFPCSPEIGSLNNNKLIEGHALKKNELTNKKSNTHLDFIFDIIEQNPYNSIELENIDLRHLENKNLAKKNISIMGTPGENHFFLQTVSISNPCSLLGRFALIDENISDFCKKIIGKNSVGNSEIIDAEIVYAPDARIANIARRPKLSEFEIPIYYESCQEIENQILLNDILISIENGEISLWSEKLNKKINPKLSNAHNFNTNENNYYRFLSSLQYQNENNLNININYSVRKKRHVPRISYYNIVLHRATWVLFESDISIIKNSHNKLEELKIFLQKWKVTKYVVLVQGDNELFIDTSNDSYLLLLLDETKNSKLIQLCEDITTTENSVVPNEQVILTMKGNIDESLSFTGNKNIENKSDIKRDFQPGSEWFYIKIYCNSNISDHLLANEIFDVIENILANNIAESMFFIRYNDPHYHIRIRVKLHDLKKFSSVASIFYNVLNSLFIQESIWKIQLDTYSREIERYGSEEILNAEQVFFYDSYCTFELLREENHISDNLKLFIAVLNIDFWLLAFNLTLQERLDFCKKMSEAFSLEFSDSYKTHINQKFRELKNDLNLFLNTTSKKNKFAKRNDNIKGLKLSKNNLSSYIHMSLNRWFSSEQRALEFMSYVFAMKQYEKKLNNSNNK